MLKPIPFSIRLLLLQTCLIQFASSNELSNIDQASDTTVAEETVHSGEQGLEEEIEEAHAVLFPTFTLTIGVLVFYVLSRHIKALPYTAVMFLIGTLMGISATLTGFDNHISRTLMQWIHINSEVLLLVFLPGLIFKDAFGQNVHLFLYSIGQLLVFAFPMVLAGTVLGALICYYIFPYGWSFNLSMTVGSILAATDPVAVAALLEEVGAPPRLKVHVAGESLLNDGSAIVFFSIFSERYFNEFGIPGVGEEIDAARGVSLFCQKAIGGAAAGLFFGIGLLGLLFLLNRRFSREENVVQVTAVIGVAYLNYYVSDFVWKTSGVIATVVAGVTVKLIGHAMVNDLTLLEDFLTVVEHILNTVLFTLGGVVWGAVIAAEEKSGIWTAREWGYLILLYVLLHVIRAIQFTIAFPLISRIGLLTNARETCFQIFGGLRGAVGIALAIALDNEVSVITGGGEIDTVDEKNTQKAFVMVGGIAFFTLAINGVLAGPLLRKLKLAESSDARKKVLEAYKLRLRASSIDDMVRLLSQDRFRHVNFAFVKFHVPHVADLTKHQLMLAVDKHKGTSPTEDYKPPHLTNIIPYLKEDPNEILDDSSRKIEEQLRKDHETNERNARILQRHKNRKNRRDKRVSTSNLHYMMGHDPLSVQELRVLFISILKASYDKQVQMGELDDSHILSISLEQSLEFALSAVNKGEPLKDWEFLLLVHKPIAKTIKNMKNLSLVQRLLGFFVSSRRAELGLKAKTENMYIERSLAFMSAHRVAQEFFSIELQDADSELSEAAKIVMEESRYQYALAEEALKEFNVYTTEMAISHKFCKILLTMNIQWVENLVRLGLLKESEAEPFLEELEEHLEHVDCCDMNHHPGESQQDILSRTRRSETLDHFKIDEHFRPGIDPLLEEDEGEGDAIFDDSDDVIET